MSCLAASQWEPDGGWKEGWCLHLFSDPSPTPPPASALADPLIHPVPRLCVLSFTEPGTHAHTNYQ